MRINDREIDVDVRAELEAFEWSHARWLPNKLIACSPFRDERKPSFYVYLEDTETAGAGMWQDSGSYDEEYGRGHFVKLLAFLRNESEAETASYLLEAYGGYIDEERMQLKPHPKFSLDRADHMDIAALEPLKFRSPYLASRGVSEHVQRAMRVGYDKDRRAVSMPWVDARGRLITIKYRRIDDKVFWYDERGADITRHLYGERLLHVKRPKRIVLVEAEIDALWLLTCGIFAIATGNKFFTRHRAELIVKSSAEEVIIGRDNDAAGKEMRDKVVSFLQGRVELFDWSLPSSAKDINDIRDEEIVRSIVEQTTPITRKTRLRM